MIRARIKSLLVFFAALFAALFSPLSWAPYGITTPVIVDDPVGCAASFTNCAALRNGTTLQAFHVYKTFTDFSNFERLTFGTCNYTPPAGSNTSNLCLFSDVAGTGIPRRLQLGGSAGWLVDITQIQGGTGTGNLVPFIDNQVNIGALGANPQRPSQIHAAIRMTIAGNQVAYTLCKTAVAAAAPGDTSEDILFTCTVPAGAIGNTGAFRLHFMSTVTNNANNKTIRVRFGGIAGTAYFSAVVGTGVANLSGQVQIQNRNFQNSQVGDATAFASNATIAQGVTTSAVDTSAASTDVVITCQKAVAGDTCQFEAATAEILQ